MKVKTKDAVEAMFDEAVEGAHKTLTQVERAFVEGSPAWKRCPVDGTRFVERSTAYPHGQPAGARFCSASCKSAAGAAKAGHKARRTENYPPNVDGTLGGLVERRIGGPRKVSRMEVEGSRPFKVRLGTTDITAYPSDKRQRPYDPADGLTHSEVAELDGLDE